MMRVALEQLKNKHNLIGAEIGVYYGETASDYLENLDIEKVFLVDPYKKRPCDSEHFMEEVKNEAHTKLSLYKDKIIWVEVKSAEAVNVIEDGSLDFVYIDADHRYEFVRQDITLYYPKVKKGGLVSGHDYRGHTPGVKKAVDEFCEKNNLVLHRGGKMDWWIWK